MKIFLTERILKTENVATQDLVFKWNEYSLYVPLLQVRNMYLYINNYIFGIPYFRLINKESFKIFVKQRRSLNFKTTLGLLSRDEETEFHDNRATRAWKQALGMPFNYEIPGMPLKLLWSMRSFYPTDI